MRPTIKFTAEWSKTSINFLDVTIPIAKGIIETDLYVKPTDSHQYLLSSSYHHFHCKKRFFLLLLFHLPIIYLSLAISFFLNFIFHLLTSYYILIFLLLLLLLLSFFIIIIVFIVMLINIFVTVIFEKSSGGEFQARNSSGMDYPYSSR